MIRLLLHAAEDHPEFIPISPQLMEWVNSCIQVVSSEVSVVVTDEALVALIFDYCKIITMQKSPLTTSRWHDPFYVWWTVWGMYSSDRHLSPDQLTHPLAAFKYIMRLTILKAVLTAPEIRNLQVLDLQTRFVFIAMEFMITMYSSRSFFMTISSQLYFADVVFCQGKRNYHHPIWVGLRFDVFVYRICIFIIEYHQDLLESLQCRGTFYRWAIGDIEEDL